MKIKCNNLFSDNNLFIFSLIVLVCGSISVSCTQTAPTPSSQVLAKVGNVRLYESEVTTLFPTTMDETKRKQYVESYIQDWVQNEVLRQEALRLGLDKDSETKFRLEELERSFLAQRLKEIWVANSDTLVVSTEEAQAFYLQNKDQFTLHERHVRFRHVQTATLEQSLDAKSDLLKGLDFESVVNKYALETLATLNNAQQFFPISMAIPDNEPMHQYLQVIGINEISPIRLVNGRYHFVQLLNQKSKGERPDLTWILDQIKEWLLLEKKRKRITSIQQEILLRAELNNEITIY